MKETVLRSSIWSSGGSRFQVSGQYSRNQGLNLKPKPETLKPETFFRDINIPQFSTTPSTEEAKPEN
jgi:hypothetical protein